MAQRVGNSFCGKVLLFGEYSVIMGGKAFVVPFEKVSGSLQISQDLVQNTESARQSNNALTDFLQWLATLSDDPAMRYKINTRKLGQDIKNGLFFSSDIPQGYGLGSSGALVAAIFTAYGQAIPGLSHLTSEELKIVSPDLKGQLGRMESFFHGSSSGLDPLGSLLRRPFVYSPSEGFTFPDGSVNNQDAPHRIFLIDTGKARNTSTLVQWFKDQVHAGSIDGEKFTDLNDRVLQSFYMQDHLFPELLHQLSVYQKINLTPMIPDVASDFWQQGIESGKWTLKICGSGGGGYMLAFTSHPELFESSLSRLGLESISLY